MNIKFKKSDGTVVPGQVTLQDEADENEDLVAVKIKLAEKTYEARAESYFETLQNLRKELERDGIQILCNGAARNVYPSPMTLAMGYGRKAYKMTWGKQAPRKDLVEIFDYDESLVCCGVGGAESVLYGLDSEFEKVVELRTFYFMLIFAL